MNRLVNRTAFVLALSALFSAVSGFAQAAAQKSIAVLSVVNSAYVGEDKFYGDADELSGVTASLMAMILDDVKDVESVTYEDVRRNRLEYQESEAGEVPASVEAAQIEFARAMGYDYAVLGEILEAKVKTSKKRLSLDSFNKKNFTIWGSMKVSVYDVATGEMVLSREYKGEHFVSLDRNMAAMHLEFTGVKKFEPELEKVSADPEEFGRSCLGDPFVSIFMQLNEDLSEKIFMEDKK